MKKPVDPKFTLLVLLSAVLIIGAIFWFILSRARPQFVPTRPPLRAPAAARPIVTPPPHAVTPSTSAPRADAAPRSPVIPTAAASAAALPSTAPHAGVTIQEGKTIDFSSGQPVLKDSPEEKELIARSVKEMEAAAGEITFGPTAKKPVATTPPK